MDIFALHRAEIQAAKDIYFRLSPLYFDILPFLLRILSFGTTIYLSEYFRSRVSQAEATVASPLCNKEADNHGYDPQNNTSLVKLASPASRPRYLARRTPTGPSKQLVVAACPSPSSTPSPTSKCLFGLRRAIYHYPNRARCIKNSSPVSILFRPRQAVRNGARGPPTALPALANGARKTAGAWSVAGTSQYDNSSSSNYPYGSINPLALTSLSSFSQPMSQQLAGTQNNPTPFVSTEEPGSARARNRDFACPCAVFDPKGENRCVDAAGHTDSSRVKQHLKSVHSRHGRCRRCHRSVDEHPEDQSDSNCTAKPRKWPRKYYIDDVELYNRLDIPAQKGKRKDGEQEERWYTYLAIFLCSHFKKPFQSIRLDVLKKRYKPYQDDLKATKQSPSPPLSCDDLFNDTTYETIDNVQVGNYQTAQAFLASTSEVANHTTQGRDMTISFHQELEQMPGSNLGFFQDILHDERTPDVPAQSDQQASMVPWVMSPARQPATPSQQPMAGFTGSSAQSQPSLRIPRTPAAASSSSNFDVLSPSPLAAATAAAPTPTPTPTTTMTSPPPHPRRPARPWTEWEWQMFLKANEQRMNDLERQLENKSLIIKRLRKEKRQETKRLRREKREETRRKNSRYQGVQSCANALVLMANDNPDIQAIVETLMDLGRVEREEQDDDDEEDEEDDDE